MDVRVGATPMEATAITVNAVISMSSVAKTLRSVGPLWVAPARTPSVGNSSLSAVPAPFVRRGGTLANAA